MYKFGNFHSHRNTQILNALVEVPTNFVGTPACRWIFRNHPFLRNSWNGANRVVQKNTGSNTAYVEQTTSTPVGRPLERKVILNDPQTASPAGCTIIKAPSPAKNCAPVDGEYPRLKASVMMPAHRTSAFVKNVRMNIGYHASWA